MIVDAPFGRGLTAAFVFSFLLLGTGVAEAQPRFRFDQMPGHLSKDVAPVRLDLALDLDPKRDSFEGRIEIEVRVRAPVAGIELHAHELSAGEAWIDGGTSKRAAAGDRQPMDVRIDTAAQTWLLARRDGAPVAAGVHRIALAYTGKVQQQGMALYRANAVVGGDTLPMLATQLEPIHARRVFPTFDEPAFRARFLLTVRAPAELQVLSNMPSTQRSVAKGIATHRFAATPPMPSYLVAVAVGRFDILEGKAAGLPVRVFTAPGKREQARYALDITRQLLPFYSHYFGTPFALPRLDQLAVPSTRWGAMEDWGLISYNEGLLLVDPATASPAQLRSVFSIVAHEVAHQWFGDLVTAGSWNEIWLNEAFATWMSNKAADHFNPTWQVRLNGRGRVDETMAGDSSDATRAIRSGPVRETAVFDVFDSITYVKGGAVLEMIEQWLGEDAFRRGLAAYMRDRKFSNATAGDLWFHVGRAAGRDVGAMATSWTDQPGFPLVSVTTTCEGGRTRVALAQQRFRYDTADRSAASSAATPALPRWRIPVRLARGTTAWTVLLADAQARTTLPGCSDEPVRANAGGHGYYHVAYEPEAMRALHDRFASLPGPDRMALLADTLALAQAGRLPLSEGLDWLTLLPQVRDAGRVPLFKQAIEAFALLDKALAGSPKQSALRASARDLLAPELARLGWEPGPQDDPETLSLRAGLVRQLASMDDAATLEQALTRVTRDESGAQPLHPSMRDDVRIAAGASADRARFDRTLAALLAASSEQERRTLAKALASGRDHGRVDELLDRMLKGDLPNNLATSMPARVAALSPFGDRAYRHVVEHWSAWEQLAGPTGKRWLLPETAEDSNDPAQARALIADQARLAGPDGAMLAARAAARIEQLAAVKARAAMPGP